MPILDYNIRHGRTYLYDKHEPLYAFGHGLTYTTFEYADLKLGKSTIREGDVVNISLDVKNTGTMNSDEVVQLYASFPESKVMRPAKVLKGFNGSMYPARETVRVIILFRRILS